MTNNDKYIYIYIYIYNCDNWTNSSI
jgi:hypothetical protein